MSSPVVSPAVMPPAKQKEEVSSSSTNYVRWIFIFILILVIFVGMYMFFKFFTTPGKLKNNTMRMNNNARLR
jgi:hypothetical protein